jgi:hypothetical protein
MATKVKRSARTSLSEFAKHGMQYLLRRDQISPLKKEQDREKAWLKKYIGDGDTPGEGVPDSEGNLNVYFDSPVPGPKDTIYYGLTQRYTAGTQYMDEDEIKQFVKTLDPELADRVVYTVTTTVVDTDELYKLYHEKHITAKELRNLVHHHDPSYQLWPITDPPVEEDEG